MVSSVESRIKVLGPGAKNFAATFGNPVSQTGLMTSEKAYQRSAFFRRCVELRGEALSGIPFTIRDSTGSVIHDSDAFSDWPEQLLWLSELPELLKLKEESQILRGVAYWRPLMQRGRRTGIQWVDANTLKPLYNARGEVSGYERHYTDPGGTHKREEWAASTIIPFFQTSPLTEGQRAAEYPLGRVAALNGDVLYSMDSFLERYMQLGLMPTTIVALPPDTPDEERARFSGLWGRFMSGWRNAGRNLVINAEDVKVQKVGDGLSELGNAEITKEQREAIAAVLGVPMSLVLSGHAGRSTAGQEDENFYTKAVIPSAKRAAREINRYFQREGENLHLRFEYKRIDALQRAQLEEAKALQRVASGPFVTRNEARELIGLPPATDEQMEELRANNNSVEGAGSQEELDAIIRPEPLSERAENEIRAWRTKVERKGKAVPFQPASIPPDVFEVICDRLDMGDDVDAAFAPPYVY